MAPGVAEWNGAISMGSSPPVWLVPSMWSPWNGLSIGSSRCTRLLFGRPSPGTIQQHQQRFVGSTLQLPRLGHVSLLLLGLSSGSRHLDGRLGWGSYCRRHTPCWCHSSSTKGGSHCHAGPLQSRHGSPLQGVPEGDGTAAGHCHLDGQPESCRQLVQEVPAVAPAAMGNAVEQWRFLLGGCEDCLVGRCGLSGSHGEVYLLTRLCKRAFLFHRPCFWSPSWRFGRRSAICSQGAMTFGDQATWAMSWGSFSWRVLMCVVVARNCL